MSLIPDARGFFSASLCHAMDKGGVSIKELSVETEISFEHARKLVRGTALPSPELLARMVRVVPIDYSEARQRVTHDQIVRRYGDAAWAAAGINPALAPFYVIIPY